MNARLAGWHLTSSKRLVATLIASALALAACSSSGEGRDEASRPDAGADGADLPTSPGHGSANLPTVPSRPDDSIVVTTTDTVPITMTSTSTTTTTAPPPVIPSDVLFDSNQVVLKPEAEPYLQDLADQTRERYPNAALHFVGHTDSRGSDSYNRDLSLRRANAVLEWFVGHGFDRAQLTADGAGESRLVEVDVRPDGTYDEEAGQRNRRVEIEIRP